MAAQSSTPSTPPDPFRSKRLIYRAIEDNEEDTTFIQNHLNEPAMYLLSTEVLPRPRTQRNATEFVARQQSQLLGVMVCLPSEDAGSEDDWRKATPIGRVSLKNPMGALTAHHRNALIGISLIASVRGQGYGREAINWVLDWAFEIGALHRVSLEVLSHNERALGLYRSLGFVEEGRLREAVWQFRKWHDVITLGMLEGEWLKLRGREE
ncbi:hypothetical protein ASPCAL00599 [Aspergillus calidoustus]|uniref:N-acetyltransferase domain-containing protein n=1 Tax=Aspergillus calidoustus TaxID=454130 RepID=A0A0U5FV85_ASPCI|nr:hypothetical protein ASPCAL00599 [Aspergillus calidoustus]